MKIHPPVRVVAAHPGAWAVRAAFVSVALTACGGGGGGSSDSTPPPPPPPAPALPSGTTLAGIAASGAPLAGATISVTDSDGSTVDPAAVTADANGAYSIDVSGLRLPLVLKAAGGDLPAPLIALVNALTGAGANTANVTPLTQAIAALLAPGGDPQALLTPATLAALDTSKLAGATALLVNTLKTDTALAALLGANFNPLSTPFVANGTGIDAALDQVQVDLAAGGVSITNLAAPVGSVAAPVTLTPAQVSNPTTPPTLPPSSPDPLPGAAELAALGAKLQACLALPLAQRVTQGSDGTVTAVSATCDFAPPDWRSNGRTWVQEVGQNTFAVAALDGATVGKGQIALTAAAPNYVDPKEFKHPYCNTATCVVVRYPFTTASGKTLQTDWLLAKVAGQWNYVGNQLPYRLGADPRMYRIEDSITVTPPSYFATNRYESALRVTVDPSVGNTNNIRAVRVTGPGLPAAGLVLMRSQTCTSQDRFAIVAQNGSTRVFNSPATFQFWTGASTADFILDAARLDGTALGMPVPVNDGVSLSNQQFAPAPVANQAALIPAWARYKFELFHFDVLSDTPDEVLYARINYAAENAAAGVGKAWPVLAPAFVNAYLKPGGSGAGTVSSLAQTIDWTNPAGGYVNFAYLFSRNTVNTTNGTGDAAANYVKRNRLDFTPASYGVTSATGTAWAKAESSASLSSFTATNGSNPNPRCTNTNLEPLVSTATSDYREAGLQFRGSDRKLYQATWAWQN